MKLDASLDAPLLTCVYAQRSKPDTKETEGVKIVDSVYIPVSKLGPMIPNGKMNNETCLLSVIDTNFPCYSDKNSARQSTGSAGWELIEIDCKCRLLDSMMCWGHRQALSGG